MDYQFMLILFLVVISIIMLTTILVSWGKEVKKYNSRKKRVDQLSFNAKEKDVSVDQFIGGLTNFVDKKILKVKPSDSDILLEKRLKMVELDKQFGVKEWKVFKMFMCFVGVLAGGIFALVNVWFGAFVGVFLSIAPSLFLHIQAKEVRLKLLTKFPDIIMIMEGYLSAGFTLNKAVEETIKFGGTTWTPILKKMVADMDIMGVEYALNELKEMSDVDEIREFASLVKIAHEQGDVGGSFTAQVERMRVIQEDVIMQKIDGRRSLAVAANMPTMIAVFILVGAPALGNLMMISTAG